jgi:dehydrogenase/reductase SDR family protein 7B
MKDFKEKKVWITGASSGIGRALVFAFIKRGAFVIASSNDAEGLEKVKHECGDLSDKVSCVEFDLSETSVIKNIVDKQLGTNGRIDILLNIGGISQRALIEETPMWLDRKIMEINYFGTIAFTKAILPYMIRQKSGHILATSSISGRFGFPLRAAYSASKQALHGFFETLYLENKKYNIKSSVIIPGRVRTNISFSDLYGRGVGQGIMDEGQAKGISPERAAEIILRGIRRNKREILVGSTELLMLFIRRFLPCVFFKIADRVKPT